MIMSNIAKFKKQDAEQCVCFATVCFKKANAKHTYFMTYT